MVNSNSAPRSGYTPGIPPFTGTATKTRTKVSVASKVLVSLGILGATAGFAAALVGSGEVQPIIQSATTYTLASLVAQGQGTIAVSPAGKVLGSCGGDCQLRAYPVGTVVTLTETPANSTWMFGGWGNDCGGASTTCAVTMTSNHNVAAFFVPARTLTSFVAQGQGTIVASPSGQCSVTRGCELRDYPDGTVVTLTETPASGYVFASWGNDCGGASTTCTVTMDSNHNVAAFFVSARTLSVSKTGTGAGTVTSNPVGISCGSTCSTSYPDGAFVTLTARASTSSKFTSWSGACSGTSSTCTVTMNAAKLVTASFALVSPPPPPIQ